MKKGFALATTLVVMAFVMAISSLLLALVLTEDINCKLAKRDLEQNILITQYGQDFADNNLQEFQNIYSDFTPIANDDCTILKNDSITLILSGENLNNKLVVKNLIETKTYLTVEKVNGVVTVWQQN